MELEAGQEVPKLQSLKLSCKKLVNFQGFFSDVAVSELPELLLATSINPSTRVGWNHFGLSIVWDDQTSLTFPQGKSHHSKEEEMRCEAVKCTVT